MTVDVDGAAKTETAVATRAHFFACLAMIWSLILS